MPQLKTASSLLMKEFNVKPRFRIKCKGIISDLYDEIIGEKKTVSQLQIYQMLIRLTPLLQEEAGVIPDDPPCNLGGDVHGDF